jgi:hypothetical protein
MRVRITFIVGFTKPSALDSTRREFECIRPVSVDGVAEHASPGDSFIVNTTAGVTNDDTTMDPLPVEVLDFTQSEEELIEKMQNIIQFFLDLLEVTGGDLAQENCVWFLICHRWENGNARLLMVQESHSGIDITSRLTGTVSGVKTKSPEEGHMTLGF